MESTNTGAAPGPEGDLPLCVRQPGTGAGKPAWRRRIVIALLVTALLAAGALLWSLRPVPPDAAPPAAAPIPSGIAALGRLEPAGGVIAITPPGPSRDAIVRELLVEEGATVASGDVLAVMETRAGAEAALGEAAAQVSLREAELAQARRALEADRAETEAQIALARVRLVGAEQALDRASQLTGSTTTQARLEELQTDRDARAAELAQAEARRVQLAGDLEDHPNIRSARAALDAARAALLRAETDLEDTHVRAPATGRIISVAVRPGEPASSDGLMRLAVDGPGEAVLEVHQDRIHLVRQGAPVTLRAPAIDGALTGTVDRIGVEVQRQAVFAADPAANTDARVFEVRVTLDPASSAVARDLINLQVLATIETEATR